MSVGIQHVFVGTLDVVVGTQFKHMYLWIHNICLWILIVIFDKLNTVLWVKHEIANSDTLTTSS